MGNAKKNSIITAIIITIGSPLLVIASSSLQPEEKFKVVLPAFLSKAMKEVPSDDEIQKLLKASYNERRAVTAALYEEMEIAGGFGQYGVIADSARRQMRTGLEIHEGPAQKVEFLKEIMAFCEKMAPRLNVAIQNDTRARALERHKFREFIYDVNIEMVKAKRAAAKEKK